MPKDRLRYVCSNCGEASLSWAGKCPQCGAWNTLQEEAVIETGGFGGTTATSGRALKSASVDTLIKHDQARLITGMNDVDVVLGGGIVQGSVNLIAGQPGIGKSTLLLQLADSIAKKYKVLYVSGEESGHQIGLRAERLGVNSK